VCHHISLFFIVCCTGEFGNLVVVFALCLCSFFLCVSLCVSAVSCPVFVDRSNFRFGVKKLI